MAPGDAFAPDAYGGLAYNQGDEHDAPFGMMTVFGDFTGAFTFYAALSDTGTTGHGSETNGGVADSNTLVVLGELDISSSNVEDWLVAAEADGYGHYVDSGESWLLAVSTNLIFGQTGFADYSFGDSLPAESMTLPTPLSEGSWQINIVEYTVYDDGTFLAGQQDTSNLGGHGYGHSASGLVLSIEASAESNMSRQSESESEPASAVAPSLLQGVIQGADGIHITWEDEEETPRTFTIQRKIDNGDWVTVHLNYGTVHGWLDHRVETGHTYTYRVKASNGEELDSDWTEMSYSLEY